jgi:hypothetical protein
MDKIKKQYIYFLDNKDSLIKKYPGKILVISDNFEVYAFDSKEDAYTFGVKTFGFGNMLIQECSESAISKVRKFHSRVYCK